MLHIAPLSLKAQLCYLTGGSFSSLAITLVGLIGWRAQEYYKTFDEATGPEWGYTNVGITALIAFFTFAGVTVTLVLETTHYYVRFAFHPSHAGQCWKLHRHAALVVQTVVGALFVVGGVVAVVKWAGNPASCGFIFCLGVDDHPDTSDSTRGSPIDTLFAVMMFAVLVPPGLVMLCRVHTLWLQLACNSTPLGPISESTPSAATTSPSPDEAVPNTCDDPDAPLVVHSETSQSHTSSPESAHGGSTTGRETPTSSSSAKPMSMQPYHATPWKQQLSRIIGVCAGIVACAVLTFWLPNDSRSWTAAGIAWFARTTIAPDRRTNTETVPELPTAYFRTGQVRVSDNLVLKLFPGNVFFYVYLLATALIVFVLRQTQTGRYWMQRRIPQCACFTYGEAAFVAATALLVGCFAMYWLHDHNYKNSWSAKRPSQAIDQPERWGRGLGQLAILFLSLLLLPVGRQSVVVSVLGVSRDGLLWFHRAVGYAMLAATVAHIVAFYVSYAQYGQLMHNLNKIPSIVGKSGVFDDYTVVAATWTTWFMLVAMGIFGLNYMRRRYYELFYYTHLAATYMTIPLMILHAAAGWMYLLPGMTVLVADQMVRLWQRSAVVRVVHARVISEDTTELAFTVPDRWDMRRVHPGQYVLVCVPELSALQWHPFTLTSVIDEEAACARTTVFHVHIKSMGPKTWTGRLYDLARTGQTFSVAVEGPCGTPVDYRRYEDVVLVAGGIGAAPCVSVYGSLLREHVRGAAGVPRVRLVWSTRSASLVGAVADMLLLPAPYRDLVFQGSVEGATSGDRTMSRVEVNTALSHASGLVDVPDAFFCNIFVTRTVEYARCAAVCAESSELSRSEEARESHETRVNSRMHTSSLVNLGGHVSVREGRPDVKREVELALTDPMTGTVSGDVRRKLVLVCGPMSLVEETAKVAARLGVVVHTEEFLF